MSRPERPFFGLEEKYRQMSEKFDDKDGWDLPQRLFPTSDGLIHDFEVDDYVAFLNSVVSHSDLVEGLQNLSSLADDALIRAQEMTSEDFGRFKEAMARERDLSEAQEESGSQMPEEWLPILMPERFLQAYLMAQSFNVPLGARLL